MSVLLIGGTGTLGQEITRQLGSRMPQRSITVFSRDEFKQSEMRREFPGVNYVIGDVRDRDALRAVMRGMESVFLLAAIKHIDVAEKNPIEAIKTNVLGAMNVAEAAIANEVQYVVYSNTDKAVLPITTYGYTKALAQNLLLALNDGHETEFSVFNWGNIAASRGSVIQTFVRSLLSMGSVHVTDTRMSRFWISIEDAARFMLANYRSSRGDRAMIPPIKGATIIRVVETIAKILRVEKYEIKTIGLRGTEKLYEVLDSTHEHCLRSDTCKQYSDTELTTLLAPVVLLEAKRCGSTSTDISGTWGGATAPSSIISASNGAAKTSKARRMAVLKVPSDAS